MVLPTNSKYNGRPNVITALSSKFKRPWLSFRGLVTFLVVALLVHKMRPYYFGPTIDVYLKPIADPISSKLANCPQKIQSQAVPMAVIVIGSSRHDYLKQVLDSLQQQTVTNFQVYVFLDFCETEGCQQVVDLVAKFDQYKAHRAKSNIGIARMSLWAIETVLEAPERWQRFLFLEDDHLIGHTYLQAMGYLLEAAQAMPKVAVVNGNFIDTPSTGMSGQIHERRPYFVKQFDPSRCQFQLVEPLAANTDVNGHDVWAWATTREKFQTVLGDFKTAFSASHLDTLPYQQRNRTRIVQVMQQYCAGSGYTQWGGQDWLRACLFYHHGMTQKLQPTSRLMTYIGQQGLHMTPKVFGRLGFETVGVEQVSKDVSDYPRQLCDKLCHFKTVPRYDRWAWFRKRKRKSLGGVV